MLTIEVARGWYAQDDAVHGFGHIQRVYALCERIGLSEGADMPILLAAALLHDARGSHPGGDSRNDHHLRSAEFAEEILSEERWEGEKIRAVQHCIRAHRFRQDEPPRSLEAKVLFDADKLDVIGAIGVVRALTYAFQINQPAYSNPSPHFLKTGEKEPGEPHSAYHEYLFKLKHIASTLFSPTARQIAVVRQAFLDSFFRELAEEMNSGS